MKFFSSRRIGATAMVFLAVCPVEAADEIQTNQPPPPAAVKIEFDRDIQPILAASCLRCHGPEKPKSHFRLDNRAAALKGGDENTNDIIPGAGSKSLVINYVARQVPDLEMPPVGKGDPLTPQQIALLRAWIDQGAEWSATNQFPLTTLTFSPTLRWMDVSGNQSKFRQLEGVTPGFSGGAEEFSFTEQASPDEKISVTGHVIAPNQDVDVKLKVDRTDLGFVHAGFDQWRTYYNDVGGYSPVMTPPEYSLNRDLYVDNGDAWINFGLTLPHQPTVIVGYEYQYQNGNKSMLDWGQVYNNQSNPNISTKAIYPATQAVDEHAHIVKLDVAADIDDWHLANNARLEFYSASNLGTEASFNNPGETSPDTFINTQDRYQSTQGMDTLMLEKQILDWWFLSGGFYYSKLEASDFFNQVTTSTVFGNSQLSSQEITLDQQSEIFSVASLFKPLANLTFSVGTQNEWTTQHGFGDSIPDLDLGEPNSPAANVPAGSNSDLFKASQDASLRYTKIPFTVLFADGRFDQESVNQFQYQDPNDPTQDTKTQTDATNYRYDFSTGFDTSPWRWCSLKAQYQYQYSDTDYNYPVDISYGISGPGNGYPGFILNRKIKTDAFETSLDLRPANWVKTTLSYKIGGTDYSSVTEEALRNGTGPVVSPGGPIQDGTTDAQTYGISATLTPIQRFYFYSAFTYTHSRTVTASNNDPSIVPYSGDIYTLNNTATYALNPKTRLQASYIFSYANYGQNNAVAGLPLGINFSRDEVLFGITRQLTAHLACALHYEFSHYNEPSSGSANDYTAQGVFATFAYKWQ